MYFFIFFSKFPKARNFTGRYKLICCTLYTKLSNEIYKNIIVYIPLISRWNPRDISDKAMKVNTPTFKGISFASIPLWEFLGANLIPVIILVSEVTEHLKLINGKKILWASKIGLYDLSWNILSLIEGRQSECNKKHFRKCLVAGLQ